MSDSSDYTDDGGNIGQSICPAGWTLPLVGPLRPRRPRSFSNLVFQYGWDSGYNSMEGGYSMWDDPLYFSLGGVYASGNIGNVGYLGAYWSSEVLGNYDATILLLYGDGYTDPYNEANCDTGFSVRCVAR